MREKPKNTQRTRQLLSYSLFIALILLPGCASISVEKEDWNLSKGTKNNGIKAPEVIYIESFKPHSDVEHLLRDEEKKLGSELSKELATRIMEYSKIPAKQSEPTTKGGYSKKKSPKIESHVWVIRGQIQKAERGSRLLRTLIGLGTGGTKLEVSTDIYEVSPKKKENLLAEISTTGGSNATPGAIFSGPYSAGPKAIILATTTGLSYDTKRTARMIAAAIDEKLGGKSGKKPKRTDAKPIEKILPPLRTRS